ncbi:MAG: hypothetical protein GF331_09175 [Chitinivibrionales bacterium]|nr:hypothetical protein [Chitinivibrionales bacterium]
MSSNSRRRFSASVVLTLAVVLGARAGDDPSDYSPADFPGPVYQVDPAGLYAVVDIENLPAVQTSAWSQENNSTAPEYGNNYTGTHFYIYRGPNYTGSHPDANHTRQGDKNTWLTFKVHIPSGGAGLYKMAVYKSHLLHDGDNDCWIGYIGMPASVPIGRYGWGARDRFSWGNQSMEDNRDGFALEEGLNAVYVGGRSKGFAVSRIAIYKATGGNKTKALNPSTPQSSPFNQNDNQAPSTPQNLAITGQTPVSLTVEWDASTDNTGVSGYRVLVDGQDKGTTSQTSMAIDGLTPETSYSITVSAVDFSGNRSGESAPVTGTTLAQGELGLPLKINVGGSTSDGFIADKAWTAGADFGYVGGSSSTAAATDGVEGTTSDAVYQSVRFKEFSYRVATGNGRFGVTLLFAEFWRTSAGTRTFSVQAEGQTMGPDPIDIYAQAGQATAYDVAGTVDVTDGILDITFTAGVSDPMISGLIVDNADITHTVMSPARTAAEHGRTVTGTALPVILNGRTIHRTVAPGAARVEIRDGTTRVSNAGR